MVAGSTPEGSLNSIVNLRGQHALVTGGGTGIGAAIAAALAEAGSQVTICGRRGDILEKAAGPRIHPVVMDVTDPANVRSATRSAVDRHGRISIHVANAGLAEGCRFESTDLEFWRRIMAVNLDGAFLTIREALDSMRQGDWGRIIAISSVAGIRGLPGASAYAASKHGLIGLTRTLSEELMGSGITANALCPGYVDTPIMDHNTRSLMKHSGRSWKEAQDYFARRNRHGRLIEPAEVANCALWLCAKGSDSINGQAIPITGGQP